RIQPGKGQQLLRQALPELHQYAKVYLLGAGQCGEAFYGLPGVNVVTEYRREDLASLVRQIGPDLAALLSVVPETFSYTLSEMQQLGVPVIATRVGAFPARIEDGKTGWLIEPRAADLVDLVRRLHGDRELLAATRKQLGPVSADTPADMVQAYRALLGAAPPAPEMPQPDPGLEQAQAASLAYLGMLEHAGRLALEDRLDELGKEVAQRTEWALDRDQALRQEQETRRRWVAQLEADIAAQQQALHEVRSELADTRHRLEENQRQLQQAQLELEQLQGVHEQVLSSLSWRLTRPLRVLRRMARNFMVSGAWNPLRWPLFIAGLVRNLTTVGWRGTLMRMQYAGPQAAPEAVPVEHLEAVGDPDPPHSLPVSAQPMASIVIPVYNNWTYTAACLRSLAEAKSTVPFEVIVVDDQSSDETPARLANIEGLKVLTNERNRGFIDSCNRGANEARGEYLVMLNNDTQVLDGWLDQLLETFRRHPDAGLVGARLLYPDGRLQECGGIVFNDASGWNYGRNDQPERPEYKHLREADYCSGACFMIETALFRELGGFDERYRPAYYEDTDLAFRVRDAGRKVLVKPASTVIHHEGVTSGTDTDSGTKRYQLINQEKFRERWQDELRDYPPRIDDPTNPAAIRAARDHHLTGRALVIDATTPEPDQDSGSLRLTNLMRCFRELGFGVTFMAENHAYAGRYTRDLRALGIEVVHQPWVESNHEFFRQRGAQFDCVLISRHYVAAHYAPLVRKYCAKAALIFDTVDLHYLREERLAELENSLPLRRVAERTRRSELGVIAQSDAVLVVSPAEVEVLAADAPNALVHVISNIHEVPGRRVDFGARSDLFFVGGYQHPPNVDAAQWFVSRIWPLIHARLPEARFHLIGSKAPDSVRALKGDGVLFHGYVEDLEHYLDRCRLAVAPLRYGAGVKGKVNMSMSYGQPVVATPAAIEGTHAEHGRDILVADSEQAFADEVVRLYQDQELWTRISDAAVANVERHFSLRAGRDSLEQLLERIQG
ncbi:MAG TPA: glycosyltransferase, partial [Xanthomonadales bacterium]|nr:glycosyltransferase [Xanthomonadales bacterium]